MSELCSIQVSSTKITVVIQYIQHLHRNPGIPQYCQHSFGQLSPSKYTCKPIKYSSVLIDSSNEKLKHLNITGNISSLNRHLGSNLNIILVQAPNPKLPQEISKRVDEA
jgi:hypothetical protein